MTDTTMNDPIPPVDPAVAAAAVDPPAPDPVPEPQPAEDPAPQPEEPRVHGNKGRKPWYLDRISEESEARRQAESRAQELQAMLERARTAPDPANTAEPRATDDVETRARQIAQEMSNKDKIRSVISAGVAKFQDWDERAATLGAAGAASPEFVLDVVSVDPINAHEILHQLADNPDKAAHLAKMDTRTRTIELVKMSLAATGTAPKPAPTEKPVPAAKQVSKAPPPPPPVDPGASQVVDWRSDKASDADFAKGWDENRKNRQGRRR